MDETDFVIRSNYLYESEDKVDSPRRFLCHFATAEFNLPVSFGFGKSLESGLTRFATWRGTTDVGGPPCRNGFCSSLYGSHMDRSL